MCSKEKLHNAHMLIAKFFYDAGFAFNAAHSIYFQASYSAAAAIGPGFVVPSYHDLRLPLLADCKRECQLIVDGYREVWAERGCTLMADGWTDKRGRTLINFLVYCSTGLCFIKSIDATSEIKTAKNLFKMFDEVLKWIGVANVVQVVTDNASNYKACGSLIHRKYPNIYWTPCAAHCLNLMLKDIAALEHVVKVVEVVVPIIKLLKFVDSDAKPSLPYVYEGMKMIVKGIKDIYNDKESLYKQYVNIVNTRWDKHLKGDLHKAAYYLNPVLVYKHKESAGEVMKTSILNLLEKPAICSDPMQALRELRLYEDAKGSFGRDLAIKGRSQFHPGN
ncbi:hypothetical protein LINPERPRIM_LOCUS12826 [Linum perenne]